MIYDSSGFIATIIMLALPSIHTLLLTRKVLHLNRRIPVSILCAAEEDVEHPVALARKVVAGAACTFHLALVVAWTPVS